MNNMVCPFRKITTFKYNYSTLGSGSHNLTKTGEEFGACYEEECPFYHKNSMGVHCERCGGEQ